MTEADWRAQRSRVATDRLLGLVEVGGKPFETLEQAVTRGGASGLDIPFALPQAVEAKLICDLGGVHGVRKILLVGEDKKDSIAELILVEHALEFLTRLDNTITIVAIDDEDDTLRVLEVVPPEGADLVLSTNIPHGELDVLVLDGLNVETDGGNGRDDLAELELVENGGLSGSVETDHENSHLLLSEEVLEDSRKGHPHLGGIGLSAGDGLERWRVWNLQREREDKCKREAEAAMAVGRAVGRCLGNARTLAMAAFGSGRVK